MRASSVVLILLLSDASAFVPSISSSFVKCQSPRQEDTSLFAMKKPPTFPTPKVTSDTPISTDSAKMKNIMEARGSLLEIEQAAEKARDYLDFLEETAAAIRSYLGDVQSIMVPYQPNLDVPDLNNAEEAAEYLANIEKATASATEYLEYLENMAKGIKTYLHKFEQEYEAGGVTAKSAERAQEAKRHKTDLEETAESAKEYLEYLKKVTGVVQQYLIDPNLAGIQDLLQVSPPAGMKTIQDFMPGKAGELSARATRVIPKKPKVEPDNSLPRPTYSLPRATRRVASIPMEEVRTAKKTPADAASRVVILGGNRAAGRSTRQVGAKTPAPQSHNPPPLTPPGAHTTRLETSTASRMSVPDVDARDLSNAAAAGEMVSAAEAAASLTPKTARVRVVPAGGGCRSAPDPVQRREVEISKQDEEAPPPQEPLPPPQPTRIMSDQEAAAAARGRRTQGTLQFFMSRAAPHLQDPDRLS
jgi:hypothetical protein